MRKNIPLKNIKPVIQNTPLENLSLKLLNLPFSDSWISESFKKETGEKFFAYKNRTKIDHAKKLLIETKTPMQEIARLAGYCDRYYFHKIFKKHTGSTPRKFRLSKETEKITTSQKRVR